MILIEIQFLYWKNERINKYSFNNQNGIQTESIVSIL